MRIRSDEVLVVVGMQGQGKTTWVKWLLTQLKNKEFFIVDVNGEYTEFPGDHIVNDPGEIEDLLETAYEKGSLVLVMDEADMYFNQISTPLKGIYYRVLHLGRHRNLLRVFVARRAADLHKDVYSQAYHIVTFRQFYPRDVDRLREFMGDDAQKVTELKDYHYLVYDTTTRELREYPPVVYRPPVQKEKEAKKGWRSWFAWLNSSHF